MRLAKAIVVALLIMALPYASILSHGDKHEEKEDDTMQAVGTAPADSAQAAPDSLYALINENYQSVRHIFEYSCFDCHSTFTNYPWYYKIPGIKGMIDEDTEEAREHLDFSNDFPFGGHESQLEQLKAIKEQIEDDEMPLMSYRFMHWGRLIEGARRDSVFEWINASLALLKPAEETGK